jgi:hypothetical protein
VVKIPRNEKIMTFMIMDRELKLKRSIMRRVYFIYAIRTIFSKKSLKFIPAALVAAELTPFLPFVSVRHVIINMPAITNLKDLYSFHVSAFMNTELIIQISIISLVLVFAAYVYRAGSRFVPPTLFLRRGATN